MEKPGQKIEAEVEARIESISGWPDRGSSSGNSKEEYVDALWILLQEEIVISDI